LTKDVIDVDPSRPLPRDELGVGSVIRTPGRTVTEADIVNFAALTGDRHPHHVDAEWAAEHGIFGERIAHGMLVLSYAFGLLPNHDLLALRRIRRATFKRPLRIGQTMSVTAEITKAQELGEGQALTSMRVRVIAEEKTVAWADVDLLMRI
jgi:acyl dehydratase